MSNGYQEFLNKYTFYVYAKCTRALSELGHFWTLCLDNITLVWDENLLFLT